MIGSLLTFFAVGLATIVVAGIVLAIVGTVIGIVGSLVSLLLFKVAPIMLVGWVILKIMDRRSKGSLSAADRKWLDGE
ncbi:MAG: hypothetical protein RQ745_03670 [Longimicrobiales bacterium]|nr:hypothetical protein [Longimicrobiales bacterium]